MTTRGLGARPESDDVGPAYYAPAGRGPWRDVRALLHPPYTFWNQAYVVLGALTAPHLNATTLVATMAAFFLALGVAAHAFDELQGRPLQTGFSRRTLKSAAVLSLVGAVALGVAGVALGRVGPWLIAFIAMGAFFVPAYNLELFGGRFHRDLGLAVVWGGFTILVSSYAQSGVVSLAALFVAAAGSLLITAQRSLSTPVRHLRRRVASVEGAFILHDGTIEPLERAALMEPSERALRAMSWAMILLATGMLLARELGHGW